MIKPAITFLTAPMDSRLFLSATRYITKQIIASAIVTNRAIVPVLSKIEKLLKFFRSDICPPLPKNMTKLKSPMLNALGLGKLPFVSINSIKFKGFNLRRFPVTPSGILNFLY